MPQVITHNVNMLSIKKPSKHDSSDVKTVTSGSEGARKRKKNESSSDRQRRGKQQNTFAACSLNCFASRQSQARGDVMNSPGASAGKRAELVLTSPAAEEK